MRNECRNPDNPDKGSQTFSCHCSICSHQIWFVSKYSISLWKVQKMYSVTFHLCNHIKAYLILAPLDSIFYSSLSIKMSLSDGVQRLTYIRNTARRNVWIPACDYCQTVWIFNMLQPHTVTLPRSENRNKSGIFSHFLNTWITANSNSPP